MKISEVCKAFSEWRSNRSGQKEAIPAYLWAMVRRLLPHYKRSVICKALGVSGRQFKLHCLDVWEEPIQNDGFVETLLPMPTANYELLLQGAHKTLHIKVPVEQLASVLPLLASYL